MKLKAGGKALIIAAVVGTAGYAANHFGYLDARTASASSVPARIDLPDGAAVPQAAVSRVNIAPAASSYVMKLQTLAWNATTGMLYANGDARTAPGSLMDKRGVKLAIERQDDYAQMTAQQVAFAKSFAAGNPNPAEGVAFVVIMGDGYPAYAAATNEAMRKLGQSVQVIGSLGYSRGEDKCMLPAAVKGNPQLARGALIGGVERDGDLHICFKWATDNNIPVNADSKTYDPDAINFVAVGAFTEADEKLIAGYAEERPVVSKGKLTGERRRVVQNGTATWTPGDVKVSTECAKPGKACAGIVAVASTLEYKWQMPATIIGNKAWMQANPVLVQNFLAAALEGGELVRGSDAALAQGAAVNAKVFKEEDAAYWKQYFKGVNGLGGSTTSGLGDNAYLFGLAGNDNLYKRVYTVFGNLDHQYYPDVMAQPLPYADVVNTSYLEALLATSTQMAKADAGAFAAGAPVGATFAKKAYSLEFETGKATFTPAAASVLDDVLNQISITGLSVQINGHTDSAGNAESNLGLSKARADAVKSWIVHNAETAFPNERVRTRGFGDTVPLADNRSSEGRAKNRRVEIILLQAN